jgi:hypothetical protein
MSESPRAATATSNMVVTGAQRRASQRPRSAARFGTCAGGRPGVESRCGTVAVGGTYLSPPFSSGGASLAQPWLRFHTALIEPDWRIYRVAQPLLAFALMEPAVRRYRSGLFREDRRQGDHLCQA